MSPSFIANQPASPRSSDAVVGGALLATGLLAGVYLSWSSAVMPGLRRVDDSTFVSSMQAMNKAIVNPAFLALFIGAPVLSIAALVRWRQVDGRQVVSRFLLVGAVLNAAGLLLTIGANVPLNDRLAAFGSPAGKTPAQVTDAREAFEGPWTRRHLLRTALTVGAFGALGAAALAAGGRKVPAGRRGVSADLSGARTPARSTS